MAERFKYILAVCIAVLLFIPAFQFKTELFKCEPLSGGITVSEKPELTKESYWDLSWQENYNKYINDNFGFRPWFVRLINQINFSLFNTTNAPGVVIGKNGELFIESYIDDYIGRNYIGGGKVNETVTKIKRVQDSLKARGIDLIVVFAPGKASFHSDLIPDRYLRKQKDSTNYKIYTEFFKQKQVNFIDLNYWFFQQKSSLKHPVYPKYGTHWNHYGMCLAVDTLNRYIEFKRNIKLPKLDYSLINYDTHLKGNDYDIGVLMNLMYPIEMDANPYPVYKFKNSSEYTKPDVLVVGDSYWWCIVGDHLPKQFYREDEYWFYNKDQLISNEKRNPVAVLNLSASLAQRNVVVLMATEATFHLFPYGFIDNCHKLYCEDNSKRLGEIMDDIRKNTEWYNKLVVKAQENKITTEQQLKLDAEYILSDELLKVVEPLPDIIHRIKGDPEWMKAIKKKAEENKLSVEEQVEKDAKWLFEQNKINYGK